MPHLRNFTLVMLCAFVAACASTPLKPLPVPVAGESGAAVIFRESAFAAGGVGLAVGVDDAGFAMLNNAQRVTARLTAGTQEFFVQARSAEPTRLKVTIKKGEVVCLRTSSSPDTYAKVAVPLVLIITGYHFYLDEVPCPSEAELAKYKEVAPVYEKPFPGVTQHSPITSPR